MIRLAFSSFPTHQGPASVVITAVLAIGLLVFPLPDFGLSSQAQAQRWLEEQQDRGARPQYRPNRAKQKKFFSTLGFGSDRPRRRSQRSFRLKRLSDVIPRGLIPGADVGQRQTLTPEQAREAATWRQRNARERGLSGTSTLRPQDETPPQTATQTQKRTYQAAKTAKNDDANIILVIGDEIGVELAEGLEDYYGQEPALAVVSRAQSKHDLILPKDSDLEPWHDQMDSLLGTKNLQAIVVALGVDDFAPITAPDGNILNPGQDAWRSAYRERIRRLAVDLTATGKPVYWMSLLPVEDSERNKKIGAVNILLEQTVTGTPVRFIDAWTAFASEEGEFMRQGPDLNGDETVLRWKDGETLTRAGRLKYAHFAARFIKVRDDLLATDSALTASSTPTYQGLQPNGKGYGPVISLFETSSSQSQNNLASAKLLLDADAAKPHSPQVRQRLIEGRPVPTQDNRADSFLWKP
jgi:hypothetical protein